MSSGHITLIREARRWGRRGWLLYVSAFWQQITSFEAVEKLTSPSIPPHSWHIGAGPRFVPILGWLITLQRTALHPSLMVQMQEPVRSGRRMRPSENYGRDGKAHASSGTMGGVPTPYC